MAPIPRALVGLLVFAALSAATPVQGQTRGCSIAQQNLFVRDVLSDIYLWSDRIPNIDPLRFNSPQEYLEAVRFRPIDQAFSYIADRAANDALFSNSEYVGFGFSSTWQGDDLRITQVFPHSAAEDAGVMRGDTITAINGRSVAELIESGEIASAFGPAERGVTASVAFVRGAETRSGHMVKRTVVIPTVSHTRVITQSGRRVGYIFFRNFVEPSVGALNDAFNEMHRQRVNELVLDLRYNGGGLVSVAQHLGGLIGGTLTSGQVFAEYSHNDRNASRNRTLRFSAPDNALSLNRVFAITTRASASASELVINALRPFLPVVVIGDRTYGKPVGQHGITFCDKVLAPVSFALRNAMGEGDYFDGLQPTCQAADGLDHQIGDPAEALFREALAFMAKGSCAPPSLRQHAPQRLGDRSSRARGWSAVVGAD
jgi:C-terminal peptidase prc